MGSSPGLAPVRSGVTKGDNSLIKKLGYFGSATMPLSTGRKSVMKTGRD